MKKVLSLLLGFIVTGSIFSQEFLVPTFFNTQYQAYEFRQFSTCNGFEARTNSFTAEADGDTDGQATVLDGTRICVQWDDQALDPVIHSELKNLFTQLGGTATAVDLNTTMWNDHQACIFPNDRCSPDQTVFCNDCDGFTITRLDQLTDGPIAQWTNSNIENAGDLVSIRKIWRPWRGDIWTNPLDFGVIEAGSFKRHNSSNRSAPGGALSSMAYADILTPSNSGNRYNFSGDVFYKFTIQSEMEVSISTDWTNTNFLTKIGLLSDEFVFLTEKSAINLSDQVTLSAALLPGTYIIVVEGASDFAEGEFTISVFTDEIDLSAGSISFDEEPTACPGMAIPDIKSGSPAGFKSFDYINTSTVTQSPIYSWYQESLGGPRTIIPGQNTDTINTQLLSFLSREFGSSIKFYRYAVFGADLVISNALEFQRCLPPSYSSCEDPVPFMPIDLAKGIFAAAAPNAGVKSSNIGVPNCVASANIGTAADLWLQLEVPFTGRMKLQFASFGVGFICYTEASTWELMIYKGSCSGGGSLVFLKCEQVILGQNYDETYSFDMTEFDGISPGDNILLRLWDSGTDDFGACIISSMTPLPCGSSTIFNSRLGPNNWNNSGSWFENTVPSGCDDVNIINGSIDINAPAECSLLQVGTGNEMTVSNGTSLIVNGKL